MQIQRSDSRLRSVRETQQEHIGRSRQLRPHLHAASERLRSVMLSNVAFCQRMIAKTVRAIHCFSRGIRADPTYCRAYVCRADGYNLIDKVSLFFIS